MITNNLLYLTPTINLINLIAELLKVSMTNFDGITLYNIIMIVINIVYYIFV